MCPRTKAKSSIYSLQVISCRLVVLNNICLLVIPSHDRSFLDAVGLCLQSCCRGEPEFVNIFKAGADKAQEVA